MLVSGLVPKKSITRGVRSNFKIDFDFFSFSTKVDFDLQLATLKTNMPDPKLAHVDPALGPFINGNLNWVLNPHPFMNWVLKQFRNPNFYGS